MLKFGKTTPVESRQDANTLNEQLHTSEITLAPFDNKRLVSLCGRFDEHLRQIEKRLGVEIINRGNVFQVLGPHDTAQTATEVIKRLFDETQQGEELTPAQVHLILQEMRSQQTEVSTSIKTRMLEVKPRSPNQLNYVQKIHQHDINFGIGPAGTGKTFIAVACAVNALEQQRVRRILLVRPAVEAGERLGFLPGDLAQKIDPYLRPLYDALYEMLGFERVAKLLEQQVIEIAPLAYMRGRTLNDAFIILDESQNTTPEQMKMFLTRLGFSSTAVITGDITQVDLPKGKESGLRHAIKVLRDLPAISFTFFNSQDVVRHPIVQKIVEAYDKYENNTQAEHSDT